MNISQILETAILSPDAQKRAEAELQLSNACGEDYPRYLGLLIETLNDNNSSLEARMLAAIAAKNSLFAKDAKTRKDLTLRWINLAPDFKKLVKESVLVNLFEAEEKIARSTAQLVAAIADIELPRSEWPELIPMIVKNTEADKPSSVKTVALLTIGYICSNGDSNNPGIVNQANGILLAIVQGAQVSEPSVKVRLTALNSLVSALEFIRFNFQKEGERNYIMQVVCEATQAENSDLKAAAFGALARIMSLYYNFMNVYMEKALYSLTVTGMQNPDEKVACMAIEFWSTVCEEERDIVQRRQELSDSLVNDTDTSDLVLFNFAMGALKDVLPTLLSLLTKQNEDPEDDEWGVASAAGACLQLLAENVGNYVIQPTLLFVENNISSDDWHRREAAIMAFGSILDGPDQDKLKGLIAEALNPILALMKDPVLQVKETVAWCLGRIADLVIDVLKDVNYLNGVIQAIAEGLKDHGRVATNCCWTLINIVEQINETSAQEETSNLSVYYGVMVPILLELSSQETNEFQSRASAYEALSTLVLYSPKDCMPYVNSIAGEILNRLEITIKLSLQQNQTSADKQNLEDLQVNILNLLTNIIRRAKIDVLSVSDSLMDVFLKLLASQAEFKEKSVIEEDVFIAIGAIASSIDEHFQKYMESFLPFLSKALQDVSSPTCKIAVGLVADISRSLQKSIIPYCEGLMNILGSHLSNVDVDRELRPAIISCFGDIASSIGDSFVQYLQVVMRILDAAQSLQPEDGSLESFENMLHVKEAILDAYVGIVAGLHDNPQELFPYVQDIIKFLETIPADVNLAGSDSVCCSAVGLIGDLAKMYGPKIQPWLQRDWVPEFIKYVRTSPKFYPTTKQTAKWAKSMINSF